MFVCKSKFNRGDKYLDPQPQLREFRCEAWAKDALSNSQLADDAWSCDTELKLMWLTQGEAIANKEKVQ